MTVDLRESLHEEASGEARCLRMIKLTMLGRGGRRRKGSWSSRGSSCEFVISAAATVEHLLSENGETPQPQSLGLFGKPHIAFTSEPAVGEV